MSSLSEEGKYQEQNCKLLFSTTVYVSFSQSFEIKGQQIIWASVRLNIELYNFFPGLLAKSR